MINKLSYFVQYDHDPYLNLALEEYFLRHVEVGQCILYLWQNANTIVIGKNQNPWSECRVTEFNAKGGRIARRLSGGGAVYHDLGNQNFTFLLKEKDYDVARQTRIILKALASLGIAAALTGRNDLTIAGRKFSGHAYYSSRGNSYQHGTIMVDVDENKLSQFLTVSKAKLEKRSIASVRSRVINLREVLPELSLESLREALIKATSEEFSLAAEPLEESFIDKEAVQVLREKYASWDFLYGSRLSFPEKLEGAFSWGEVKLEYKVERGLIEDLAIYSDSLEADEIAFIPELLKGTRYVLEEISAKLNLLEHKEIKKDLAELFAKALEQENSMNEFDVVVIGGGPGGYVCAAECAKLGKKTALVEKDALGGTCLNRGCIPTKSLLHAAELYTEISRGEEFGVKAENISVDFAKLKARKNEVILSLRAGIEMMLKGAKVTVFKGEGFVPEAGKVLVKTSEAEEVLACKDIVIATGSVPARPPIKGLDLPGVLTSDDLLENVPALESLVIIGGGVIGLEFATLYSQLGTKVTVIEGLPKILATMDKDISSSLTLQMKKQGVEIVTGAMVGSVEEAAGQLKCVYTVKGEEKETLGQAVLVAVGRKVELNKVFAEGLVPDLERGRAIVDEKMQSSIPHVYVIGDAANGYPQLAHAASAQGLVVASAISGLESKINLKLVPGCVYTSPEIASVGLTEAEAKEQGLAVHVGKVPTGSNGKSVLTNQERGFVKVLADDEGKLIGAQLYSARATDMVGELALAIANGLSEVDAASVIRPHPTFEEMLGEALAVSVQKGAKKKK